MLVAVNVSPLMSSLDATSDVPLTQVCPPMPVVPLPSVCGPVICTVQPVAGTLAVIVQPVGTVSVEDGAPGACGAVRLKVIGAAPPGSQAAAVVRVALTPNMKQLPARRAIGVATVAVLTSAGAVPVNVV